MRAVKALVNLRICADSPEPSLLADKIVPKFHTLTHLRCELGVTLVRRCFRDLNNHATVICKLDAKGRACEKTAKTSISPLNNDFLLHVLKCLNKIA